MLKMTINIGDFVKISHSQYPCCVILKNNTKYLVSLREFGGDYKWVQTVEKLNLNEFQKLDEISKYSNWVSEFGKNWFLEVKEHYKLLAYLSSFFNNETIVDIGTYRGLSALALSYNSSNKIITYDIIDNFNGYKNI